VQNYDRWRTAIHDGYTNILDAMHNCLLPAIDRAAVVQNRLKVLNRMPAVRLLNVDQTVFTRMSDTLDTLRLFGHATMQFAATESRQFDAFAPWLQNTLQYANAEIHSATATELIEKLANADFLQILPYISEALEYSKLEGLLTSSSLEAMQMVAKEAPVMVKDDIAEFMINSRDGAHPDGTITPREINFLFQGLRWRASVENVLGAVQKEFMHSIKKQEYPSQYQLSQMRDMRSERKTQTSTSKTGNVGQFVTYTAGVVTGTSDTRMSSNSACLVGFSDTRSDHLLVVEYDRRYADTCSYNHYLHGRKYHTNTFRRLQLHPRGSPQSR